MYLREYTNIKSIYNFVNSYKAHIIIPKYILKDKLKRTKNISLLETEDDFTLVHKNYYYKDCLSI